MMSLSRRQAEALLLQAHQDLAELDHQVAQDEIDPATAAVLRDVYRKEAEEAEGLLASQPDEAPPGEEPGISSGFRLSRRLAAIVAVAVVMVAVVLSVGGFVRSRAPGAPITGGSEGVARGGFEQSAPTEGFDPSAYSDETLEALVAANVDDPQIAGMRVALADRYFSRGDYQAAFPHYQAVLETEPPPSPVLVATALGRLGWIVYRGNGEVDLALDLFDQALALRPGDAHTTYLKALVLWCGAGQPAEAVDLLEQVLSSPQVEEEAQADVEADLAGARQGESCG